MNVNTKLFLNLFNKDFFHFFAIALLSVFPVLFFVGTGILNLGIILLDLIFISELIKKKRINFLKNYIFYSLILLWLILSIVCLDF